MMIGKYANYKQSGVDWVGVIPDHWSLAPIRWVCTVFSGGTPDRSVEEYWNSPDIPWLNSGEVNKNHIWNSENFISHQGLKESSAKWVKPSSVLMALAGQGKTKGSVASLEIRATCNQSMAAIEPNVNKLSYRFLYYYLKSRYNQIRGLVGEDRDGLNLELVKNIKVPLPPLCEQQLIADFLFKKTSLIDETIRKKQRLIKLLQEERAGLINQAVTKGLDPEVPLKDSGVEWLREIPAHWDLKKLKYLAKVRNGYAFKSETYTPEGTPVVRIGDLKDEIDLHAAKRVPESIAAENSDFKIQKDEILVALTGATIGKSARFTSNENALLNQRVGAFRATEKITPDFLWYIVQSHLFSLYIELECFGGAQENIGKEQLGEFVFTIPPLDEQLEIVEHIESESGKIAQVVLREEQLIRLLEEYRKSLINEVVTGKRCVLSEEELEKLTKDQELVS